MARRSPRPHRFRATGFRAVSLPALALATVTLGSLSVDAQVAPTKRDLSQGNTLYTIPYSHLDTQWRWAYPQVIREYIPNTMRDNLALIAKYPHYVFNFSGSRRYEMMKEYYPEDFKRVAAAIRAGRWFPCGSSVDEGDANVPSGESLVRHVLYGNDYFRKQFGVASEEFMLPDCFGFPYALPTVLAHCGIQGFSTQKLTWGSAVGIPFKVGRWIGPDGRSVVAALDPGSYGGNVTEDLSQNTSWLARIQNTGKMSGAYVDYHYYGTGDQGGAPRDSSVAMVEKSIAGTGPVKVVTSRADEMFLNITPAQRAKLPEYDGELLLTEHSAGSITSQAYMKRWNRKNELLADAAERASVGAMWLGGAKYPMARLNKAWGLVLGSQMHDMLPGTSLPRAYEFCWNDELLAMNQFAEVARNGVGAVAATMDTRAQGTPLVVYNPLSIAREDVVEMDAARFLPAETNRSLVIVGPDGQRVPSQVSNGKLLFLAKVPAIGFATYDVRRSPVGIFTPGELRAEGRTIENERFRVVVNEAGDIGSIYDKKAGREVLKAPTSLDFQYHNPSAFPAWNMDWDDAKKPPYGKVSGPAKIRIVENGPARVAIEIDRTSAGSRFVQTVRLSQGGGRVEVLNTIDWNTPQTALKAAFPLASGNPKATYDLQVGAIQRGNDDPKKYEVPQHQWLDLTSPDGKYGAAILNDSKFGSDKPTDDTVRLTLLYTPGVRGGYEDQATQDFGRHEILYAIAPHAGDWREGSVAWNAKRLNQPLRAFEVPSHAGSAKTLSLAGTSSKNVEITAVKRAENSNEIVVRVRELTGKPQKNVALYMATPILAARETDGQERPLKKTPVNAGTVVFDIAGYSLKTFAVKLAPAKTKVAMPTSAPVTLPYDLDAISPHGDEGDGDFDGTGRTYPAEEMAPTLDASDVAFRFGSFAKGAKNAVVAKGQTITLPAGYDRVELLLASSDGDVPASFTVGEKPVGATVQDWREFVGSWDRRLWAGTVPELAFNWSNPWAGLVPGYIKPAEVAWYASHHHKAGEGNVIYDYAKLYHTGFALNGATTITLPNDPRIKIFAMSVAKGEHAATPATPLMDTLPSHANTAPQIRTPDENAGAKAAYDDATLITLNPPLYWRAGGLRYTLDGSPVTASSPEYKGAILLHSPTTVNVAEVSADGTVGPLVTRRIDVNDTTAPRLVSARSIPDLGTATVTFSEPLDRASAEDPSHYRLNEGLQVLSAKLGPDGRTVELETTTPKTLTGNAKTIWVNGVTDLAPKANAVHNEALPVTVGGAVFTAPAMKPGVGGDYRDANLPRKATDPFTINILVKPVKPIGDLTLIAGFGNARDGQSGTGRYIAKFDDGIRFWAANQDVTTGVPFDMGSWQMITATYDGTTLRLYKDAKLIGSREIALTDDGGVARSAPLDAWQRQRRFDGELDAFTVWNGALPPRAIELLYAKLKRD